MQRYFIDKKEDKYAYLNIEDTHHLINVMRKDINDEVELIYNNNLYLAKIIEKNEPIKLEIIKEVKQDSNLFNVDIAQSLVKEQKMDYILQKSCELGVNKIIPITTTRSVIKLNGKEDKKIERWRKIVREASSQSKRVTIPDVSNILSIKDLIDLDYDVKILCSVNETSTSIKKVLEKLDISDRILFVVGAEGGFTKEEEKLLIDNGFISVSLGYNVLRTETAPLYILSVVSYNFMR